jgi:hypothetical protein
MLCSVLLHEEQATACKVDRKWTQGGRKVDPSKVPHDPCAACRVMASKWTQHITLVYIVLRHHSKIKVPLAQWLWGLVWLPPRAPA